MMYRVAFEGSLEGQQFLFRNYDDALAFASLAMDNGTYTDYHYDGNHEKYYDEPHPLMITLQGVEE
jgi:hypothetical protein